MGTQIYKKTNRVNIRKFARLSGLGMLILGLLFGLYAFFPLLSWQLFLRPAFASNNFASPIPQTTIMTQATIQSLLANSLRGGDWLPSVYENSEINSTVTRYSLAIPKIDIENAEVSTIDTDLGKHLVHFPGTPVPPSKGNGVVFGHSTLPQLFDPENYKTIFAKIHNLAIGDKFKVTVNGNTYTYSIVSIQIVDADDASYFTQQTDDSYLTVVTCTPPGTTWKRLILKSRIERIER